jgi:hypothetical protein
MTRSADMVVCNEYTLIDPDRTVFIIDNVSSCLELFAWSFYRPCQHERILGLVYVLAL